MIQVKRVYEDPEKSDGLRILAERLWPRGIKKEALKLDEWAKEAAPSTELRKWFDHDPERWDEFRTRYFKELDEHPEAWQPICDWAKKRDVTLLVSSKDLEHNNVVALKSYLERQG